MRSTSEGIFAKTSGVSPSGAGSSAGSPGGSEPSGSRRAAMWPKWRNAFTSDIAAATCRKSSGIGTRRLHGGHVSCFPFPDSRQPQTLKHRPVEVLVALEQAIEPPQKHPRLRALDDA